MQGVKKKSAFHFKLSKKYHQNMLAKLGTILGDKPPGVFYGSSKPRPLEVAIDRRIAEKFPDASVKEIKLWLRQWTGTTAYLLAAIDGTHRHNLAGRKVEEISHAHKVYARNRLKLRREKQNGNAKPAFAQRHRAFTPRKTGGIFREQTSRRDAYKGLAAKGPR